MTHIPSTLTLSSIADGSNMIASPLRNNFNAVQVVVNSILALLGEGTSGQTLASGGSTSVNWTTADAGVTAGCIIQFGAAAAPTGWLLCDGASLLRGSYAGLFSVIGTTYGTVDGTHFSVPALQGRVPVGYAATGGHSDVSTLGNAEGSTLANRRPKHPHAHTLTLPNHAHSLSDPGHDHGGVLRPDGSPSVSGDPSGGTAGSTDPASTGISVGNPTSNPTVSGAVGAAGTADDAPAYIVVNFIIKT